MGTRRIVLTALFAALIAAGAYVALPIGPVPITLQTFFVLTAALLGGRRVGIGAVVLYLALGALGLPVFSGGTGGIARFATPTGGFLIGLFPAAVLAAWFSDIGWNGVQQGRHPMRRQVFWMALGGCLATTVLYAIGIPFLKLNLGISWAKAFSVGMIPFIPGDLVKLAAAVLVAQRLSPLARSGERASDGDSRQGSASDV